MGVHDAVVVVPGIMGSELLDTTTGRTLWGLRDPRWYVNAWTSRAPLQALRLTEDERAGRYGRVRAAGLLRFPAFAPLLRGFEPYTALTTALRRVTAHPAAVLAFPYDWRLPVAHNTTLLAEAADRHLSAWRRHPAYLAARGKDPDGRPARLVIVAHSMGGLLARGLALVQGATDEVGLTVTFGTPFYGAPEAAVLLSAGRGLPVPLPAGRVRELAATLPGVHDLLPTYRCLDTGTDARSLEPDDVRDLGGDRELAECSARWHSRLSHLAPRRHVQVVGAHQPTVQALRIDAGTATGYRYTCRPAAGGGIDRIDLGGDGTVPRQSAQLPRGPAMPLGQTHGAIASTAEALLIAVDALTGTDTGPWQGGGTIGLDLPDTIEEGRTAGVVVTGAAHPRDVGCRVVDLAGNRQVDSPVLRPRDGALVATTCPLGPGLYRVGVAGGGNAPVSQILLVGPH